MGQLTRSIMRTQYLPTYLEFNSNLSSTQGPKEGCELSTTGGAGPGMLDPGRRQITGPTLHLAS